jgi:hypothetical protein
VLTAVEFDHQLLSGASKVCYALPDRMLPPEFAKRQTLAKRTPEYPFDIGRVAA